MKSTIALALAGALIAASGVTASAQQAKPVRLAGTIEKADGHTLTVKAKDGEHKLVIGDKALVVAVVKASMADIKEGTFLGSAAMPQPDGSQKAVEIHIFPETMRGTGEGHRPYDAVIPNSTMTNGSASGAMVTGVGAGTMTIKYKDGEKKLVVPAGIPILRYEVGSAADLKPGSAFTVIAATKMPDGSFEAGRINVGRGGAVPQ